ncbi:MAG: lactonase family protein [Pirellulaceae bacterium]|nr:lactonase family protein [Pirellulaceae bacterium]
MSRSSYLPMFSLTRLGLFFVALLVANGVTMTAQDSPKKKQPQNQQEMLDVWIGTGRSQLSQGIYHTQLNTSTGKLSQVTLVAEADGPGFLALHPKLPILYTVCELDKKPVVAAYAVDTGKGRASLKLVDSVEIGDGGAAHLSVEPTGHTLLTAQYGTGSVGVFALNDDGSIRSRTQLVKHEGGSKVDPKRQEAPHAHWTGFSPDNRFAFVPDLGLDKVVIYRLDAANSKIEPHGFGQLPAGSGPRHMKFDNSGRFIFVLNELALTITVFRYDAQAGNMTPIETVETVPASEKDKEQAISASEIRVHPNGRFVYSANRGHDTITAFSFDESKGHLTFIEREHVRGATPRNFNIDPTGKWLLAAGQDSHTLAAFAIDPKTGELTYNRSCVTTPSAICVLFGK